MIEQEEAGLTQITRFPYWAEIWPAAVALSRWFAGDGAPAPGVARELGCGLGLVGVALAALGWQVEATDHVEDALVFAAHNAQRNGLAARHTVAYLDWRHPAGAPCDLLVGSDLAYDKALHPDLLRTVRALLAPGGRLILADPDRPVAKAFVEAMKSAGHNHRQDSLRVAWKSLEHTVHVHTFTRGS